MLISCNNHVFLYFFLFWSSQYAIEFIAWQKLVQLILLLSNILYYLYIIAINYYYKYYNSKNFKEKFEDVLYKHDDYLNYYFYNLSFFKKLY